MPISSALDFTPFPATVFGMSAAKSEAVEMIKHLPDDATYEDIQYHLYVLEKIKRGQQRLVAKGGLSQDEMERDLAKWILS